MAKNPGGSPIGQWLAAIRRSLASESGAIAAGLITSLGVEAFPEGWIEYLSNQISPALLGNNKLQRLTARTASAMLGLSEKSQEAAEAVIMDFFETVADRSKKLSGDADENQALIDAVIRKLKNKNNEEEDHEEEDDMAKPKTSSTPAAPPAPAKPPEQTLLQVVGGLDTAIQTKFWATVQAVIQLMATQVEKDHFLARVKRVTLSKEEVTAILNAAPDDLRRDMLHQAVQRAFNAGGLSGGFRTIMDAASDGMSNLVGSGHQPSNLAAELAAGNTAKRTERAKRNGVR